MTPSEIVDSCEHAGPDRVCKKCSALAMFEMVREHVAEAVEAEREACAKVALTCPTAIFLRHSKWIAGVRSDEIAAGIRARGRR